MAQFYGVGPAYIYVGLKGNVSSKKALFLGETVKTPRIENRPGYKPVMTSSAGEVVPEDMTYQGHDAIVSCTFKRFNYEVLELLENYTLFGGTTRGAVGAGRDHVQLDRDWETIASCP